MKKVVELDAALGGVLIQDVTEIRPGEFKGPAFRKGHVVKPEDLDHFRRLGKNHLYVFTLGGNEMHEDDAAKMLASALCGQNVGFEGEPVEGKLKIIAKKSGLLKVDVQALLAFNMLGEVMCATRHTDTLVERGQEIAGTRAIPLVIERAIVDRAVRIAQDVSGIISVVELKKCTVGVVITGNEVYQGLVKDGFEPVLHRKILKLGSTISRVIVVPDNVEKISDAVLDLVAGGIDLILTTGGMSVDPDDVTRNGIARSGATHIVYGSPVLPGAMFLVANIKGIPILGIPACAMYHQITVLDLVLPRILAGEKIGRAEIASMSHGGLCLACKSCRFPDCGFGA